MSARVEVVNAQFALPYTSAIDNDVYVATNTQNQKLHIAQGPFVPASISINNKGAALFASSSTGCNLINSSICSSNIQSRVIGVNKLEFKRPLSNLFPIRNSTNTSVPGYSPSNNSILINSENSAACSNFLRTNRNQSAAITSVLGIAFQRSTSNPQYAKLQTESLSAVTSVNPILSITGSNHNSAHILMDSYLSSSSQLLASSSTTSARIAKTTDMLRFDISSNIPVNSAATFLTPLLSISSTGNVGVLDASSGARLSLSTTESLTTKKLISSCFKLTSLANQINTFTFNSANSSNTIYTSPQFTVGGGTLIFDLDLSCSTTQINSTIWVKSDLTNIANSSTTSFSNVFIINRINNERWVTFSRVVQFLAAATYTASITLSSTQTISISSANQLSLAVTELPLYTPTSELFYT